MALFKKNNIEIQIDKSTHLLVLDKKWHELFKNKKPPKVKKIEKELNDLLKIQGTLTTEHKEYLNLKKQMMDEIVNSMGEAYDDNDKAALKKMEKNKKYIDQINKKLEHHETELITIPEKISAKNKELVNLTMHTFYHTMMQNKTNSSVLEAKVNALKEEIKETIIKRDEAKEHYQNLYGYIHDVVGADIIEQYDRYFIGDNND